MIQRPMREALNPPEFDVRGMYRAVELEDSSNYEESSNMTKLLLCFEYHFIGTHGLAQRFGKKTYLHPSRIKYSRRNQTWY